MSTPRSSDRTDIPSPNAGDDPLAFPPFTHPRRIRSELVAGILRSGRRVPDESFDEGTHIDKLLRDPKVARDLASGEGNEA